MDEKKPILIPHRKGRPNNSQVAQEIEAAKLNENLLTSPSLPSLQIYYTCKHCRRKFPRLKALNTHIRIHTGDSPYKCTYPFCKSSFKQSGQLKMHLKTHTHEKDYACPVEGCSVRFAHPNRHCKDHPDKKLKRDGKGIVQYNENHTEAERQWLDNYGRNKDIPVKRKKTSNLSGASAANTSSKVPSPAKAEELPIKIQSDKSIENATVSPKQYRILGDAENTQNINFLARDSYHSANKDISVKHRKTSNAFCADTVGVSSSMLSSANFKESSCGRSEYTGLSIQMSNQLSHVLYRVYCDTERAHSMHSDNWPQNSFKESICASVIQRPETFSERIESARGLDKSSAGSLHTQHVILNSDPKPIRTPVIQSLHNSRNSIQIQPNFISADVIEAADALVLLKKISDFRKNN